MSLPDPSVQGSTSFDEGVNTYTITVTDYAANSLGGNCKLEEMLCYIISSSLAFFFVLDPLSLCYDLLMLAFGCSSVVERCNVNVTITVDQCNCAKDEQCSTDGTNVCNCPTGFAPPVTKERSKKILSGHRKSFVCTN